MGFKGVKITQVCFHDVVHEHEEFEQRNHLWIVRRKKKLLSWGAGVYVNTSILVQNLGLNSDAASDYKHMFGPRKGSLSHQWNINMKHIQLKTLWWNNQWWSEVRTRKAQTVPRWAQPQTLIVRHLYPDTDWGRSRHLVWGPIHRGTIKKKRRKQKYQPQLC